MKRGAYAPDPPRGRMDWMSRGACLGADPSLFDPLQRLERPAESRRVAQARKICARCPVIVDCLAFGIRNNETGTRGGQYLAVGVVDQRAARPGRERQT